MAPHARRNKACADSSRGQAIAGSDEIYTIGTWETADGLTLSFRDYAGRADRPALLCLHGLTRNARDFGPLADAFAGEWRLIVPEMRGRGMSDYARDPETYRIPNYLADVDALLGHLSLEEYVGVGTSMGGLMLALMAARDGSRMKGVVLNDIGPVVEKAGLERIGEYVGLGRSFPTWMHAARALREQARADHPGFDIAAWLQHAKRMMVVGNNGRIAFDYDMKIAEPFVRDGEKETADLWPAFKALGGRPGLLLHGELSDLLSAETAAHMAADIDGMDVALIPQTGHASTLEEPEAQAAIASLLARVAT
ncbi:alpha/beta fold hydrolase [Paraurantiacibacter namhicola]|uniref:3-oxoadipate enol-lactonase 2 n=1 Tax=Paraurantiacibacter namhicola TaxID=645517 RepID=A0A1C7DAA0_9SPHN|nr:alpha/beta fold hydrolase [Paraurantiacibacter namhicola]ANU08355.1 3-oxoadipate enol-lactonase 2 [Paraurantiacibacter namhicola]